MHAKASNVDVARLLLERGANKELPGMRHNGRIYGLDFFVNRAVRKEELLALLARY